MTLLSRIESHLNSAYLYELDEKCWKEIVREPTGIEVLRAAKIFREKKLIPPVRNSKIGFKCGREIILEPEYRVALKKDSPLFASLFFEEDITLECISLENFEMLLKVLYEGAPFDEIECLMLANYLDIPCLFYKAFNSLKKSIHIYTLDEALNLHAKLIPLIQFSFIKELLEQLAELFEKYDLSKINQVHSLSLTKGLEVDLRLFTNLTSLRISHPDIDEESLAFPSSLQNLSLTFCRKLTDASIERASTHLKSLFIGCTKITNVGLTGLPPYLTALNIGGCQNITSEGASHLPVTLTDLNIANLQVSVESVTRLTALIRLNMAGCETLMTNLSRISVLELTVSNVKNEDVSCLPRSLRKLNVTSSNIDSLEGLPPVYNLRIRSVCLIDDSLIYLNRGLTFLDISFSTSITAAGIWLIPRTVRHLILWRCSKINDEAMKALPRKLHSLDIAGCGLVTDEGVKFLPRSLTELDISGCRSITDAAMPFFPVNLSKVLYTNTQITLKL